MGKSGSKLKRKPSFYNINWSKFGSLPNRSKLHKNQKDILSTNGGLGTRNSFRYSNNNHNGPNNSKKHKDIHVWLTSMGLEQYQSIFSQFQGVEDLLQFSETDIKDLGVKISSHRAQMISSLTLLRAKYHEYKRPLPPIRYSVACDTTTSRDISKNDDSAIDLRTVCETTKQSKSLNNLIMEPDTSMNAADLKKALEWELSLDSRDLRSHAWYHGAIPRARAEEIVREEGGFLVRDCTSQPGNYVLTCRTKTHPLHFVINKSVLQPDTVYERVQYQFEDEAFDTVPDLITFYVGSGKPITVASAARIQFPKNRMYPLSFYATKYPAPLPQSRLTSPATTPTGHFRHSPLQAYRPANSPTRPAKSLPSKKQRSQSLTPSEVNRISQEKCNSADGVIQSPLMTRSAGAAPKFSSNSLPRTPNNKLSLSASSNTLGRVNGRLDCALSPCAEGRFFSSETDSGLSDSPPPKPSRLPSLVRTESANEMGHAHGLQRLTSYHASGSDSGNGSGDSALSCCAAGDAELKTCGVVIKNPRYNTLSSSESSTTLKNYQFDCQEAEDKILELALPEINVKSRFDLDNFETILLPVGENKPLDAQALRGIKMILKDSGSRVLANHLTRTDLDLIFARDEMDFIQKRLVSGIELVTLPNGHQFRLDLIERIECLKLLVAVTILTCTDESERTETLNKWIEIAIDTKTALGNLFGFCGIMLGLCLPQIERLDTTWHMLRQKFTDSAFNFEAKLRPTLKNMNSCSNPQAPNTTIPHLLPLILLLERGLDDFLSPSDQNQLSHSCLGLWELNSQDFGLSTILAHLQSARKYVDLSASFERNAEIVLEDGGRVDELTLDMFRTEFQLKFLWGSRGAYADAADRHCKFEQVLKVMAEKYCNLKCETEV